MSCQRKRRNLAILVHCNLIILQLTMYIAIVNLLLLVQLAENFFAKLKSSIAKYLCLPYWILYIYYNHFPLTDIPKCIKSELSSTQVQCVQSHFCRNFKHYLDFFGQACKEPVGILNNVMSNLNYLFQFFALPHKHLCYKHCRG